MKGEGSLTRARITYMFRETFRAHSKEEYREFLARGLGENKRGITGTYPWLYVRLFFILFILFTLNTLVLRFTGNTLYVPTVTMLAGITFTLPFMVLLYELYQKRDLSVLKLFGILVIGGTVASLLTQLGYAFIEVKDSWLTALITGVVEEISKAAVAIAAILVMRNKNSYACFLIAAAVGAGFSIIEDTGYIFYYSNMAAAEYGDIRDTVYLFLDRGFSSLCTHVLWTGIIGWAFGFSKGKYKPLFIFLLGYSILLHALWNLPLEGWMHSIAIGICTIITVVSNIVAVRKSLFETLSNEVDVARINEEIIEKAKEMGERMRFTNAANLTFALTCTLLSVLAIAVCCLPIGMAKVSVHYESKEDFISVIQRDYDIIADWSREYVDGGVDVERRYILDDGELQLSYVVQETSLDGYDGTYYYGYYVTNGVANKRADSIFLELEDVSSRIPCVEYTFGSDRVWVFEVSGDDYSNYTYNRTDGSVSCVVDGKEFSGYNLLIGLGAGAVGIAGACCIILFAFTLKLRKVRDEGE